jgi:lantibiotic modifying enzyme
LLGKADKSKPGFSWPSSAMPTTRNLTGFSHGAAGIGYALLELFHVTRDSKYRKAAESAFAYERYWYDRSEQNWPDLREVPGQPRPSRKALPFRLAWCHGAPGIASSRLRAHEILKRNACKSEALLAVETTRRAVESQLHSPNANYCLCHGLFGNAEVLRYASAVLQPDASQACNAVLDVAVKGIERFSRTENSWPCGTPAGQNPSLMLGLAGIGHFYLRLAVPSVPSVLILRREEFSSRNGTLLKGRHVS